MAARAVRVGLVDKGEGYRGKRWGVRWWEEPGSGRALKRFFDRKGEAVAFRDELLARSRTGTYVARRAERTVAAWAQDWLRLQAGSSLSAGTLEKYRSSLRAWILPALGDRLLGEVTKSDLQALMARMREADRAEWTVGSVWLTLRHLFQAAADERLIEINPCLLFSRRGEKPRQQRRRVPRPFSRADLQALWAVCDDDDALLFAMTARMGLRQQEVLALRVTDLDLERQPARVSIHARRDRRSGEVVEGAKSAAGVRTLPLFADLADMLRGHISRHGLLGDDYLFASHAAASDDDDVAQAARMHANGVSYRGIGRALGVSDRTAAKYVAQAAGERRRRLKTPMTDRTARDRFQAACARAGLDGRQFKDLRNTAVTQLLADGVPPSLVQRFVGHATSRMTMEVYNVLQDRDLDVIVSEPPAARPPLRALPTGSAGPGWASGAPLNRSA